eukprot:gene29033-35044_t
MEIWSYTIAAGTKVFREFRKERPEDFSNLGRSRYLRQKHPIQRLLVETNITNPNNPVDEVVPPCIPIIGKTAIIIGQDYGSIVNYTTAVQMPDLYGTMAYTSLSNLTGLGSPIDYGSGVQWASGLMQKFPTSALQLGLWLVEVIRGNLDGNIDALASYINASSPHAVYLRIGYEFDSLENAYDAETYKQAFRRIATRIRGGGLVPRRGLRALVCRVLIPAAIHHQRR